MAAGWRPGKVIPRCCQTSCLSMQGMAPSAPRPPCPWLNFAPEETVDDRWWGLPATLGPLPGMTSDEEQALRRRVRFLCHRMRTSRHQEEEGTPGCLSHVGCSSMTGAQRSNAPPASRVLSTLRWQRDSVRSSTPPRNGSGERAASRARSCFAGGGHPRPCTVCRRRSTGPGCRQSDRVSWSSGAGARLGNQTSYQSWLANAALGTPRGGDARCRCASPHPRGGAAESHDGDRHGRTYSSATFSA